MTFPQAPSERNSRTRWLKIAAAFWLLLISAVALINSVGLSRLAEQTQSSAQDAQFRRWACAWPISNNRPMRTSGGRRRSARPNSPPRGRRWTNG